MQGAGARPGAPQTPSPPRPGGGREHLAQLADGRRQSEQPIAPHDRRVLSELALLANFERPRPWDTYQRPHGERQDPACAAGRGQQDWRVGRDKAKTNHVLLLLCLNVGVDPPDVQRVDPCAKLECWTDPLVAQSKMLTKGSEVIGDLLTEQYRQLQKTAIYKCGLELSVDDLKRDLQSMRKKAKDGRVLVHYNGHGVPRMTQYGELWFFDEGHTQYVPVGISDIMQNVGSPTIYVLDCSNAGAILHYWYRQNFHQTRKKDILICACRMNEDLPLNPALPADLLTSCLTTPVQASLEWYYLYSHRECLLPTVTHDMIQKIPGALQDRKTPLGELNWIFMAVTDQIAWCTLPRDQFNKLFRPRNDVLLVALFRNFLLADRIMRETGCTPLTHPPLAETHTHPMWEAWELALERVLAQLPALTSSADYVYKPSSFFTEQLTAFEIWVDFGSKDKGAPDELPCIIQGLSSWQYRVRSLKLLARYLDLGPWAVHDALSCGVMPYVGRLLHQADLIYVMVVIWTKILLVDRSETTLNDLLRHPQPTARNFVKAIVPPPEPEARGAQPSASGGPGDDGRDSECAASGGVEQPVVMEGMTLGQCQGLACYLMCVLIDGGGWSAQCSCWNWQLLPQLRIALQSKESGVRSWAALCVARLIRNYPDARDHCVQRAELHRNELQGLMQDPSQEVRACCAAALAQLVGGGAQRGASTRVLSCDITMLHMLVKLSDDPSPLVRDEVVCTLSSFVDAYGASPALQALAGSSVKPMESHRMTLGSQVYSASVETRSRLHDDNPSEQFSQHGGTTPQQPHRRDHAAPVLAPPWPGPRTEMSPQQRAALQRSARACWAAVAPVNPAAGMPRKPDEETPRPSQELQAMIRRDPEVVRIAQFDERVQRVINTLHSADVLTFNELEMQLLDTPVQHGSEKETPSEASEGKEADDERAARMRKLLQEDVAELASRLLGDPFPAVRQRAAALVAAAAAHGGGREGQWAHQRGASPPGQALQQQQGQAPAAAAGAAAPPPEVLPRSRLFQWMEERTERPLLRSDVSGPAAERARWRAQMARDALQQFQAKGAQRRFVGHASSPPPPLSKDSFAVTPLPLAPGRVTAARFRAVMPQVITATQSGQVQLVDFDGPQPRVVAEVAHWAPVCEVLLLGDGSESPSVIVADTKGSVAVYSGLGNTGAQSPRRGGAAVSGAQPVGGAVAGLRLDTAFRAAPPPSARGRVCADVLHLDGALLYSSETAKILKFSVAEERLVQQINVQAQRGYLTALRCDQVATRMLVGGFDDGSVRFWDARSGDNHQVCQWLPCRGAPDPVVDLWIRSASHHVYVGYRSGAVRVWDLRSHQERKLEATRGKDRVLAAMVLHQTFPLVVCASEGADRPRAAKSQQGASLDFTSTKNDALGSMPISIPNGGLTMALHPYAPTIVADRNLIFF
eukprot:TRINITY_DN26081_c0_g1_i1.p1 TRINITY_DN26081_c0_g1~~TRINITY_DN26081_c0_g1_i1.p1  ORF type:complete len:1456 (+),score=459.88 TRINITY_DN26081_c0_g1_i1:77-4369(+)